MKEKLIVLVQSYPELPALSSTMNILIAYTLMKNNDWSNLPSRLWLLSNIRRNLPLLPLKVGTQAAPSTRPCSDPSTRKAICWGQVAAM